MVLRHTPLRENQRLLYALAEWPTNSSLQLQRMAHENLKLGPWRCTNKTVPVTREGKALGMLDISDPRHARLVRPDTDMLSLTPEENMKDLNNDDANCGGVIVGLAGSYTADGERLADNASIAWPRMRPFKLSSNEYWVIWYFSCPKSAHIQ